MHGKSVPATNMFESHTKVSRSYTARIGMVEGHSKTMGHPIGCIPFTVFHNYLTEDSDNSKATRLEQCNRTAIYAVNLRSKLDPVFK
jgi:hypothetical protein